MTSLKDGKTPRRINYRDFPAKMTISEIQSFIGEIEENPSLYEEKGFNNRNEVIDFIGFQIIDQIEQLAQKTNHPDKLILLKHRVEKIKAELEEVDIRLFKRIRGNIRIERYTAKSFKNLINEYVDSNPDHNEYQDETGYDNLDIFMNGLSLFQNMPEQTKDL